MNPVTRKEVFLDAICDGEPCNLEPASREEQVLKKLAESMVGGGGNKPNTTIETFELWDGSEDGLIRITIRDNWLVGPFKVDGLTSAKELVGFSLSYSDGENYPQSFDVNAEVGFEWGTEFADENRNSAAVHGASDVACIFVAAGETFKSAHSSFVFTEGLWLGCYDDGGFYTGLILGNGKRVGLAKEIFEPIDVRALPEGVLNADTFTNLTPDGTAYGVVCMYNGGGFICRSEVQNATGTNVSAEKFNELLDALRYCGILG